MSSTIFKQQFAGFRSDSNNSDSKFLADLRIVKASMGFIDLFKSSPACEEREEKKFTRAEVAQHWEEDSCWIILKDQVYDITKFQKTHPGGREVLLECAGHDATTDFFAVGHSEESLRLLQQYRIGSLVDSAKSWNNKQ